VQAFFQTEYEEAAFRIALEDAAPLYRESLEAREQKQAGMRVAVAFVKEALPDLTTARRAFVAELLVTTMSQVGEAVSEKAKSKADVEKWVAEMADMLCAYVEHLAA
jgi:hypothetical protein